MILNASMVLMVSPTFIMNPPTVLNTPTVLKISPMVLMISPMVLMISPMVLMISPMVLNTPMVLHTPHGTAHTLYRVILVSCQLGKSDSVQGFEFGNQHLATMVLRVFEFRSRIQISLIECNLASYFLMCKSRDTISFVKLLLEFTVALIGQKIQAEEK